jgi:hypothetical protein
MGKIELRADLANVFSRFKTANATPEASKGALNAHVVPAGSFRRGWSWFAANPRRLQAEDHLIVLSKFAKPALFAACNCHPLTVR